MKANIPWQKQPTEMVLSSINLLKIDKRQAFLSFDQNVEHILKVFLGLPETIIGTKLSYKERQAAISGSFHELITATKQIAGDKLDNIDLYHVKYFHDIRNELYHQAQGLTIDSDLCIDYARLSVELLKALLDVNLTQDLEKVINEIELPFLKGFPELERAIDQYKIFLDEYVDNFKKMLSLASDIHKKIMAIFTTPEMKERSISVIQKYTRSYFTGVDEGNTLIQSQKLNFDEFKTYKREIQDLILDTSLRNLFLSLNEEDQNLILVYIGLELPDLLGLAPLNYTKQYYPDKINNMAPDARTSLFCALIGIDIDAEVDAFAHEVDYINQLDGFIIDKVARLYQNLEILEKYRNKLA